MLNEIVRIEGEKGVLKKPFSPLYPFKPEGLLDLRPRMNIVDERSSSVIEKFHSDRTRSGRPRGTSGTKNLDQLTISGFDAEEGVPINRINFCDATFDYDLGGASDVIDLLDVWGDPHDQKECCQYDEVKLKLRLLRRFAARELCFQLFPPPLDEHAEHEQGRHHDAEDQESALKVEGFEVRFHPEISWGILPGKNEQLGSLAQRY